MRTEMLSGGGRAPRFRALWVCLVGAAILAGSPVGVLADASGGGGPTGTGGAGQPAPKP